MVLAMEFPENRSFWDETLRARIRDQKSLAIAIAVAWCTQFWSHMTFSDVIWNITCGDCLCPGTYRKAKDRKKSSDTD